MRSRKKSARSGSAKVDIHAVAAHARVSIATVSRTLNGVNSVDAALAKRVWKAVAALNYKPNTQARALVSGKSTLIGLIITEITNPFFPQLIEEFERAAVKNGYEILIASTSHNPLNMEECVSRMLQRKVDGVAIMTFGCEEAVLDQFAADNIPVVFIDVGAKQPSSGVLSIDYATGIGEGVQHLAVLGHRKIGFISGPLHRSSKARKAAFLESLRAAGLIARPAWMIEGDHTLEGGRDAMQKILLLKDLPTAIMCSNDVTAIGVQHSLFDAGLKVPDDFSLIGFDDIHLAEYTIPPLTTVRMSCKDLAQNAVQILLSHINPDGGKTPIRIEIPTRLIVRQTTGFPKGTLEDMPTKARVAKHLGRGKAAAKI